MKRGDLLVKIHADEPGLAVGVLDGAGLAFGLGWVLRVFMAINSMRHFPRGCRLVPRARTDGRWAESTPTLRARSPTGLVVRSPRYGVGLEAHT